MPEELASTIGKAIGYMLPAIQLAGVIIASLIMTAVLVGLTVRLLKRFSEKGSPRSWKLMLALRFLLGFREEKQSWFRRLVPVAAQNFIAMTGTAIGVWALIVVLSVMSGFELDLKEKIIRNNPHITVERCAGTAENFDDSAGCEELTGSIGEVAGVTAVESYTQGEALLASRTNMGPGTTIRGISPDGPLQDLWLKNTVSEGGIEGLKKPETTIGDRDLGFVFMDAEKRQRLKDKIKLENGEPLDQTSDLPDEEPDGEGETAFVEIPPIAVPDDRIKVRDGILLGAELALGLSLSDGDEVMLVVPDGDVGPLGVQPSTSTFRVAGTIKSGLYEYDMKTAFVLKGSGRKLFNSPARERIAIMVDDLKNLDEIAAQITELTNEIPGARVRTVTQTNRSLFSALMVEKIAMFLVLGLVILVAAFNVFGSLLLITMEKTRDIAVLRSMGVTRNGIRSIYFTIGSVIGLTGTLSGLALGLLTCLYIMTAGIALPAEYYIERLPVAINALDVVLVVLAALGAALIATVYPTSVVASISPADGLRND